MCHLFQKSKFRTSKMTKIAFSFLQKLPNLISHKTWGSQSENCQLTSPGLYLFELYYFFCKKRIFFSSNYVIHFPFLFHISLFRLMVLNHANAFPCILICIKFKCILEWNPISIKSAIYQKRTELIQSKVDPIWMKS